MSVVAPPTTSTAYSLEEFLIDLEHGDINITNGIYEYFSATDVVKLKKYKEKLKRVRDYTIVARGKKKKEMQGHKSRLIGLIFEKIVVILVSGCKALTYVSNVRSTVSEIDVLLKVEPTAGIFPMLRAAGTHLIGEAKCLTSGIKSEWINELAGLLTIHNANLAILFVACPSKPVSGGHRIAIALNAANNRRIIPFGIKQIEQIENGGNFLQLLCDQYVNAMTHSTDLHI